MATNPMQRKARMYGLVGALVTLVITGIIIIFLLMQLSQMKEKEAAMGSVWVLTTDVKSGIAIDGNLKKVSVPSEAVPLDAITEISTTAVAKIDLSMGTTITEGMITESDEEITSDVRLMEYNMIVLPSRLEAEDYIDVRLQLPTGQDFIVVSRKRVEDANAETVWMNLNEQEILTMSSAVVESYMMTGSKLYAVTYTDAGIQTETVDTYYPNADVVALMNTDPNIVDRAYEEVLRRMQSIREGAYQQIINQYQEKGLENIESGVTEEITKSVEARQEYVESMGL